MALTRLNQVPEATAQAVFEMGLLALVQHQKLAKIDPATLQSTFIQHMPDVSTAAEAIGRIRKAACDSKGADVSLNLAARPHTAVGGCAFYIEVDAMTDEMLLFRLNEHVHHVKTVVDRLNASAMQAHDVNVCVGGGAVGFSALVVRGPLTRTQVEHICLYRSRVVELVRNIDPSKWRETNIRLGPGQSGAGAVAVDPFFSSPELFNENAAADDSIGDQSSLLTRTLVELEARSNASAVPLSCEQKASLLHDILNELTATDTAATAATAGTSAIVATAGTSAIVAGAGASTVPETP